MQGLKKGRQKHRPENPRSNPFAQAAETLAPGAVILFCLPDLSFL